MNDTNFPLPFQKGDLKLLSIEALSTQLRVSRAFTRLCVDAGCPTKDGKLSSAELLQWLFENYGLTRKISGFPPLADVDGTAPETARRLKMGNAVITLLEFGESRASSRAEKRQLRKVRQTVELALERA